MGEKNVIAVVGATGAQGGGLVRAILADRNSDFRVRAITRNPDSPKAKALAEAGAEVVAGDSDNVDSMTNALQGAYGAFMVTNFWEHFSPEREDQQAHNLAQAAKNAGVKHVVWSTLEDTREKIPLTDDRMPTLGNGKYKVPHFDAKGAADKYFRELNVPTTFLRTTFYWDNLIHFGMGPRRAEDGTLELVLPMGDKRLAGIAAGDIGGVAYGIFKEGLSNVGKYIGIAGDFPTGEQMAAGLSRATGEPVRYNAVSPEVYRSFGFPGADDLGNMFQYYQDFEDDFCNDRPLDRARRLNPDLQSFDQWLANAGSQIPVPAAAA
jgi:uncharacterized protein YbjT (DUF2867 family)